MTPEDLAALRAITPQCPEWDAEPYSTHITVWPKADHARVFRVLAYYNGLSYSEMFRRLVDLELVRMVDYGDLDQASIPPRVSKGVTARAKVGPDVVPDELADGVREFLIFEHSQPEEEWPICQEKGCDNLTPQRDEEFCGNHEVDEYGVREADCYCSQGHADNMDIDICDHHRRVWQ